MVSTQLLKPLSLSVLKPLSLHDPGCRQDLCTATEKDLQRRGCVDYTATAAELLDSFNIRQSFQVKDYFKGEHCLNSSLAL